jgi:Ala-tRNA(Pro) deacylase
MPATKLKNFLEQNNIDYITILHDPVYTAQEKAESAHVSGKDLAKTVLVKIDGELSMVVLAANEKLVLPELKKELGVAKVSLADEKYFVSFFPGCEPGAVPPFGNVYGMDVYISDALSRDREIVFNAGSHIELIKLSMSDYNKIVNPRVINSSVTI